MEIPLRGNVKDVNLIKILVYLNRNRKTGTLSITTPAFKKNIYIRAGDAIFASSTYTDDRLGEMLLKAGRITVEQYDKSVEMLRSSSKRLGAILVDLGYLNPHDLAWSVTHQAREIIHSMFHIEDGEYEFREGDLPADEVITLKLSMGNLIHEGVKRLENWTIIRNEMPDMDTALKLSADPLSLFQDIELGGEDKNILSLIDGSKTINQIIEASGLGSFEALKILYMLWSTGIVEQAAAIQPEHGNGEAPQEKAAGNAGLNEILQPHPEEEDALLNKVGSMYSKINSLSISELLGVDENSDSDTIKKNFYRLAKEYHPDRYFSCPDSSIKTKLTAIFDAITKAYNRLSDDRLRREYFRPVVSKDKGQEVDLKSLAEAQYRKGIVEFKKGNFWGAAENFKWATKMTPKNSKYWKHLSLTLSNIPGRLKNAEEALLTAIKLEPFNADYYADLGDIYIKAGLKKRAFSTFQSALRIDNKNEQAQQGLALTKE